MSAPMMGSREHGQCPNCRHGFEPGPDCASTAKTRGQNRQAEKRETRRVLDGLDVEIGGTG